MGEYAEMMLDGTCCANCGEFIDGDAPGFPGYCSARCARDSESNLPQPEPRHSKRNSPRDTPCTFCGKKLRGAEGLAQHIRNAHPLTPREKAMKRDVGELVAALNTAREALADCYDVVDHPGDGSSSQDAAIKKIDTLLAKIGGA
jgi:hypothetical protein